MDKWADILYSFDADSSEPVVSRLVAEYNTIDGSSKNSHFHRRNLWATRLSELLRKAKDYEKLEKLYREWHTRERDNEDWTNMLYEALNAKSDVDGLLSLCQEVVGMIYSSSLHLRNSILETWTKRLVEALFKIGHHGAVSELYRDLLARFQESSTDAILH
ncbi:MAG: hypothetical protein MMC33_005721 [Icmadophila ericetorum]|nr:hypothetical protein [Icmadophila ericetorum]